MVHRPGARPDGTPALSRRDLFRYGALAGAGALLPQLGSAREKIADEVKTLIWIVPDGGESQVDTWDPKPDSPEQIRGPFRPIATAIPGVHVTELYPRMARMLGNVALLRARHTSGSLDHLQAMQAMLQRDGHKHIVSEHARASLGFDPIYAETPGVIKGYDYRGAAYGAQSLCMEMQWDADKKRFRLPEQAPPDPAMRGRLQLLEKMERPRGAPDDFDRTRQRAVEFLTRNRKLHQMDPKTVDRYGGENPISMGVVTIRQMVKQGLTGAYVFRAGDFDDHWGIKDGLGARAPQMDAALSALIEELKDGDLGDALLVYGGEFGRTPKMESNGGRDHFALSSGFLCGKGIKEGVVHGRTDKMGYARDGVTSAQHFGDAIRHALGMKIDEGRIARLPPIFA